MSKGLMPPAVGHQKESMPPRRAASAGLEPAVASSSDAGQQTAVAAASLSTIPAAAPPSPPPSGTTPEIVLPPPSIEIHDADAEAAAFNGPAVDVEQDPNKLYPPAQPFTPLHDAMPEAGRPAPTITTLEESAASMQVATPVVDAPTPVPTPPPSSQTQRTPPRHGPGSKDPVVPAAPVLVPDIKLGPGSVPPSPPKKPTPGQPVASSSHTPAAKAPPPSGPTTPAGPTAATHHDLFGTARAPTDASQGSANEMEKDDDAPGKTDAVGELADGGPDTAGGHGSYADMDMCSKQGDGSWQFSDEQAAELDKLEGGMMVAGGFVSAVLAGKDAKEKYTAYLAAKSAWKSAMASAKAAPTPANQQAVASTKEAMADAWNDFLQAAAEAAAGGLTLGSGGAKIDAAVKSVAKDDSGAATSSATSESLGAAGSIVSGVLDVIEMVKDARSFIKDWGTTTRRDRADKAATVTEDVAAVVGDGLDTTQGIAKAASASGGEALKGVAQASGILSVVVGAIELAHGGFQMHTAGNAVDDAKKGITALKAARDGVKTEAEGATNEANRLRLNTLWGMLNGLIAELEPSLEQLSTLSRSKFENGRTKAAAGALAATSGVLMMTGVGMPVAIPLAVAAVLLKAGHAGAKYRRSKNVENLQQLARTIDNGSQDGWEDVGYRDMESTLKGKYYEQIQTVVADKNGVPKILAKQADNEEIRNFVQEEKLNKGSGKESAPYDRLTDIPKSESPDWARTHDQTEKPSKYRQAKLKFVPAARKSKASINASVAELTAAVFAMGKSAWDPATKGFVSASVTVSKGDDAGPELTDATAGKSTVDFLLAVGITEATWGAMTQAAGSDDKKLEEQVAKRVASLAG